MLTITLQFDLKDGAVGNEKWISDIEWAEAAAFVHSPRFIWMANGKLSGWLKLYGPLTQIVVHGAGHYVPMDQPIAALDMITKFVFNQHFDTGQAYDYASHDFTPAQNMNTRPSVSFGDWKQRVWMGIVLVVLAVLGTLLFARQAIRR
jgi:hypothetical protein